MVRKSKQGVAGVVSAAVLAAALWPCCTLLACPVQAVTPVTAAAPCHEEPAHAPEDGTCPVCQLRYAAADKVDLAATHSMALVVAIPVERTVDLLVLPVLETQPIQLDPANAPPRAALFLLHRSLRI